MLWARIWRLDNRFALQGRGLTGDGLVLLVRLSVAAAVVWYPLRLLLDYRQGYLPYPPSYPPR